MINFTVKYVAWVGTTAYAVTRTRTETETLDLHGLNREDAHREVERFINTNWDALAESLKIITGHSQQMRDVVTAVLDRYIVPYRIGGPLGIDDSYILI